MQKKKKYILFSIRTILLAVAIFFAHGVADAAYLLQNCSFTVSGLNNGWDYTMGYKFTPTANGQIVQLGGYFSGTKTVRLYDSAFVSIASASVTSANNWSYTAITPVSVTSGNVYYVVVELANSGGAYGYVTVPASCANATINNGAYQYPTGTFNASYNNAGSSIYGVADVDFTTTSPPAVTSSTVTSVTGTTATLGATITSDGGSAITSRGTCWGTSASPVSNCSVEGGTAVGAFTQARTGLSANTLIYYRGYAVNSVGTGYSPDGTFRTPVSGGAPLISPTATGVSTSTVTLGATITSDGGNTITARGTCWATTAAPTINCVAEGGTSVSTFTHVRTGLPQATLIYYRGYSTNSAGTSYSADATFTTGGSGGGGTTYTFTNCSQVGNTGPTQAQCTSAYTSSTLAGLVTVSTNGYQNWTVPAGVASLNITAYGAQGASYGGGTGGLGSSMMGSFSVTPGQVLTILVGQQAVDSGSYGAGGGGTFVASGSSYTTATPLVVAGGGGGATASGNYGTNASTGTTGGGPAGGTNGNGASAVMCGGGGGGFYSTGGTDTAYGAGGGQGFRQGGVGGRFDGYTYQPGGFGGGAPADYVGSCNLQGGGGGGYSGGSGLTTGAYQLFGYGGGSYNGGTSQTNTAGARSGNGMVVIATSASITAPVLSSATSASVATSSATLGATITSDGGGTITARGTCWNTSNSVANCSAEGNTAANAFTQARTGMPSNTLIYFWGYATNSVGTAYTTYGTFTTSSSSSAPTLTTLTAAASITATGATFGATITSDGGGTITARGTCWNTSNSVANCTAEGGTAVTAFTQARTGMSNGTLIYYWGYATNSVGTTYIGAGTFTTLTIPTVTAVSPTSGYNNGSVSITSITGTQFVSGATVKLTKSGQSDISCSGFTFTSATSLTGGTCPITSAVVGTWNVVVTNPDAQVGTYTNGFTVNALGTPILTTPTASIITMTTALLGATVTSNGGATLTSRGVCWDVTPNPVVNCTPEGGTAVSAFTQSIAGIPSGVLIYYRGYAINSSATGYSPDGTFNTLSLPTVNTPTATGITGTTAILGATITSDGGATLTARGTCWGTTASPVTNCVAEGGTATSTFTQSRTGISPNTLIYYRAYATNSAGTAYSSDGTFTTMIGGATFASPTAVNIASSSATIGATISSAGGSVLESRGTCWGTSASPTSNCLPDGSTAVAVFTQSRIGLPSNTLIYYRAYAVNDAGTTYSPDGTFSTASGFPVLTTPTVTSINSTGATLGGTITNNGGASITARGTCFGTTPNPIINCTVEGSTSTGAFTHARTGMSQGTTYYYRAYAVSSAGTGYSEDSSFSTQGTPTVTSSNATVITNASAILRGTVTGAGGTILSARGTCWGLTANPITNCSAEGTTATGAFTQTRTGLPPNTFIYYRTYATNSFGTAYSSDATFSTAIATVKTSVEQAKISTLKTGLVGYWGFEEGTGATTADLSGGGDTATLVSATWTTGKFGSGLTLDGTNSYGYVPITAGNGLDVKSPISISVWFKRAGTGSYQTLISAGNSCTSATMTGWDLRFINDTFLEFAFGSSDNVSTFNLTTNVTNPTSWHHVIGTWDGTTNTNGVKLYIDGVLITWGTATKNTSQVSSIAGANVVIGALSCVVHKFNGSLDDIRIYNRVITSDEISSLYNLNISALVANFTFDEGVGTFVTDSSGNGYGGPIVAGSSGYPQWTNGIHGSALQFSGASTDGYVNIADSALMPFFTTTAWVYKDSGGDSQQSILSSFWEIWSGGNLCYWSYSFTNQYWRCTAGGVIPTGVWTHIATTFDSSIVRHYVNGTLSWTDTATTTGTNQSFTGIGGYAGRMFKGKLDEVRIYSRALSASEITVLAQTGQTTARSSVESAKIVGLKTGLLGYWGFEEGTGTTVADLSGNGKTGTLVNTPVWTSGKFGQGIAMNGTTQYFSSTMNLGATISISAWIKSASYAGTFPLALPCAGFYFASNQVAWNCGDGTANAFTPGIASYPDANWHHFVIVNDSVANNAKLYIDGAYSGVATYRNTANAANAFTVGSSGGGGYMNGSFDDVRIYNRAITTDEISALYNMGGTGLLSWWKMDEGTGSLLGDSSGNNYTARLVGSPVWTSGKLGKALTFTGSNYATTSLNTAPSALTVSLWYNKPSYNNNDSILMEHSANFNVENGSFLIDPDSGGSCSGYYSVAVLGNTGYNVKCYTRPSAGVWHHLAFMLDKRNAAANEVNMYVDGVLQTAVSQPNVADNTNTFSDRTIYLMSYGGTAFFATGTIDDLRIYNRVLSVGEVQALSALKSVSVKGR